MFGLIWTFDFYFNKNDAGFNLQNVSTWFYPFHKAPLLKEIIKLLEWYVTTDKTHYFNDRINENLTDRESFLNRYEQMLYTVPKTKISPVIDGYQKLLENEKLFPDMDAYVDKIWSSATKDEPNEYIDCRRITFISKCVLKKVINLSFEEFMTYVEPYRKYQ